jgi:molybdate transport system substrate-binding protein
LTSIRVFSAKACAAPLKKAAALFEQESGIKVSVSVCSRHCQDQQATSAGTPGSHHFLDEIAEAKIHDLAIGGAEYLLDDGEAMGIVQRGKRRTIAMRRSALIVPAGNPAKIKGLGDLKKTGVRIGISLVDCLKGLWEDICGRAGILDSIARNVTFHANGCMALVEATAQKKVDVSFGWSAFEHLAPGRIEIIPIPENFCVYRGTGVGLLKFSQQPDAAERFMHFLASEKCRPFYREYGWVVGTADERR